MHEDSNEIMAVPRSGEMIIVEKLISSEIKNYL